MIMLRAFSKNCAFAHSEFEPEISVGATVARLSAGAAPIVTLRVVILPPRSIVIAPELSPALAQDALISRSVVNNAPGPLTFRMPPAFAAPPMLSSRAATSAPSSTFSVPKPLGPTRIWLPRTEFVRCTSSRDPAPETVIVPDDPAR